MNKNFTKIIISFILSITLILPATVASATETTTTSATPTNETTVSTNDSTVNTNNTTATNPETNNATPEATKKILFIGNSMTSTNESITRNLREMIVATGESAEVDALIYFGQGFKEYADENSKQGKEIRKQLKNKKYDIIVFQEQPRALVTAFETETYPCFKILKKLAIKNGAKPIIFMTWRFNYIYRPKIDGVRREYTPAEMLNIMTENSLKLGTDYKTRVVTAGLYVEHSNNIKPEISMWRPNENKHQSHSAAYMVASIFYRELFDKSATSVNYLGRIPGPTATYLQKIADLNMSLNKTQLIIKRGAKFKLKPSITSASLDNEYLPAESTFTYRSSNPKVAKVNAKTGKIKGKKKGKATIYVTSEQTGFTRACKVTVK